VDMHCQNNKTKWDAFKNRVHDEMSVWQLWPAYMEFTYVVFPRDCGFACCSPQWNPTSLLDRLPSWNNNRTGTLLLVAKAQAGGPIHGTNLFLWIIIL
jgi:hypothetical protein